MTASLLKPRWERPSSGAALRRVDIFAPILFVIVLADSLLRLLPWQYTTISSALEAESWVRVLQEGFLSHKAFGRDIVFTYGPWGFAVLPFYHPSLFGLQMTIQGLLCFLLMVATWRIGRSVSPRAAISLPAAVALCFAVIECVAASYEVLYLLVIWHFVLSQLGEGDVAKPGGPQSTVHCPLSTVHGPPTAGDAPRTAGGGPWTADCGLGTGLSRRCGALKWLPHSGTLLRHAFVTAAAFLSLTKFSYAVLCLAAMPVIVLYSVFKRRRFPWVLPAYALQVLVFWWLAGQRTSDLLRYVRNAAEVSSGYGEMSLAGPAWQPACFALGSLLILAAVACRYWRTDKWNAAAAFLSLGMISFITGKAAFVRHDIWHFIIAGYGLPALCLTTCALAWPVSRLARRLAVASFLPALLLAGAAFSSRGDIAPYLRRPGQTGGEYAAQWRALLGAVRDPQALKAEFRNADARVREKFPVPHVNGTFDLYSDLQVLLYANGAKCSGRPLITSYQANTPLLLRLNAEHLRGDSAPDCILFGMSPMEGHYPSLEDGLSWPELWSRYEPDCSAQPVSQFESVILRRSKAARAYHLVPLGERRTQMDTAIEVPGTEPGPVWAEIAVPLSFAGKLASAALKPPEVFLDARFADGANARFRFIRGMAAPGFLLSPFVDSPSSFSWVAATPWGDKAWQRFLANRSVRAITLTSPAAWACEKEFTVRFYRLQFAEAASQCCRFAPRYLGLLQMRSGIPGARTPALRWVPSLGAILIAPGPSRLVVPLTATNEFFAVSPETRSLRVAYGGLVLPGGDTNGGPITFRIVAVSSSGEERTLWSKVLSPPPQGNSAATGEATLPVDLAGAQVLAFETIQDRADQAFIPFWAGIQ